MDTQLVSAFAVRLRDLLATLESTALLGVAEGRLRGLGEQLQFACMALPCDEALVALELGGLGRLRVPGVASAEQWRATDHEFLPSGTPFAYLLGGGTGYAAAVGADDAMLAALEPVMESAPRQALFVPIRLGASVVGGAALLREAAGAGDRELAMAERLAEVLALTLETFRTERVLLELFSVVLPDLCAADAPTGFGDGLERYLHRLRLTPSYRRRLELAEVVGRIAAHGSAETRLAGDVLARVEAYVRELTGDGDGDDFDLTPFDDEAEA
jgi:hypothetical protein